MAGGIHISLKEDSDKYTSGGWYMGESFSLPGLAIHLPVLKSDQKPIGRVPRFLRVGDAILGGVPLRGLIKAHVSRQYRIVFNKRTSGGGKARRGGGQGPT
jgi:hypothetical protein